MKAKLLQNKIGKLKEDEQRKSRCMNPTGGIAGAGAITKFTLVSTTGRELLIIYGSIAMAIFSAIELFWLLYFVLVHEIMSQDKQIAIKEVFTPFTSLLMLKVASHIGLFASEAAKLILDTEKDTSFYISVTLQNLFSVTIESTYVYYAYLRAKPIFQKVFPRYAKFVSAAVQFSPIMFAIQWIPYPLSRIEFQDSNVSEILIVFTQYVSILNGLSIVVFDVMLHREKLYKKRISQVENVIVSAGVTAEEGIGNGGFRPSMSRMLRLSLRESNINRQSKTVINPGFSKESK
ncbi:UNVERIFIED_CONTAM: hypothetical protein HDU68_008976 [Siphonaria sp. JEL0065]|nr:hypothetical protein HDU68_008976 [Siphonaria sp. JEL0065]